MNVVGHEHPSPHFDAGRRRMLGQQVTIEAIVVVAEESTCASVAALGDVVRQAGKDGAGKAGHGGNLARPDRHVNKVHGHRNTISPTWEWHPDSKLCFIAFAHAKV